MATVTTIWGTRDVSKIKRTYRPNFSVNKLKCLFTGILGWSKRGGITTWVALLWHLAQHSSLSLNKKTQQKSKEHTWTRVHIPLSNTFCCAAIFCTKKSSRFLPNLSPLVMSSWTLWKRDDIIVSTHFVHRYITTGKLYQ